ncbi:MAG: hypothetical protein FWF50_07855 [Defluviitaleaceae bacterium]|nr:hypothetical protein [Defluviitaleaceae bacterium]
MKKYLSSLLIIFLVFSNNVSANQTLSYSYELEPASENDLFSWWSATTEDGEERLG